MSKRIPPTISPGEQPEDTQQPADEQPPDELEVIQGLLDDIATGGGSVMVYRRAAGQHLFLGTMPASEFSPQAVADAHGGGDYYLRFKTGANTFAGAKAFSVDPSIKPKRPATAPPPETARPDPVQAAILDTLAKISERLAVPAASPVDSVKQLEALSLIVKNLQPAAGAAPAADPQLAATLARLENEVRELRGRRDESGSLLKAVETIKAIKGLELGGADAEGGADALSKLDRIINSPVAVAALQRLAGARPASPPSPVAERKAIQTAETAAASPSAAGADVPPASAPAVSMADMREVVFAAANNQRVEQFAALLEESLTFRQFNALLDTLEAETWQKDLFGDDPRATQHVLWLTNLRNLLLADEAPEAPPVAKGKKKNA